MQKERKKERKKATFYRQCVVLFFNLLLCLADVFFCVLVVWHRYYINGKMCCYDSIDLTVMVPLRVQ